MKVSALLARYLAILVLIACAVAENQPEGLGSRNGDGVCDMLVPGCCAPRVLIIGAMKCGTNAMMQYLEQHPALRNSWKEQEVHFFTGVGKQMHGIPDDLDHLSPAGRKEYAAHLVCAKPDSGMWAVDKSPSYLDDLSVAAKAHTIMPSAKVLAVLCDPAERFWKEFFHKLRFNPKYVPMCSSWTESVSRARQAFDEFVQNRTVDFERNNLTDNPDSDLARGLYGRRLKHWVDIYGHDNVLAVDSTYDMKHQRTDTIRRVLRFLGLGDQTIEADEESFQDVYASRHPTLHHSAWSRLHAFYAEDMKLLSEVTGKDWASKWRDDPNHGIDIVTETAALQGVCGEPSNSLHKVDGAI
mmetsp:Transcript_4125/g.7542  ORF Transcript_4125/g.7542 Transcript_4125/m.7542 type:complete len:355 (-) Transcript_4125:1501-2565(-)